MLAAAAAAAGDLALVGVTVLTSHDADGFAQIVGRGVPDLGLEAERLARVALQAGVRGGGASGRELAPARGPPPPAPRVAPPGVPPAGGGPGGPGPAPAPPPPPR